MLSDVIVNALMVKYFIMAFLRQKLKIISARKSSD